MKRLVLVLAIVLPFGACSKSKPDPQPSGSAAPVAPAVKAPETPKGKVVTEKFTPASLGVEKEYVVYLPADYDDKPDARYPVFYYLHGLTGNERSWVKGAHIDQAADELGLQAIIVMPDGDDSFYADSAKQVDYDACMKDGTGLFIPAVQPKPQTCVKKFAYESYVTKDLIADVDHKFRTKPARESRAIAGLSMGGFGALELSMRHPDLFAAAASHSGVDSLIYEGPHPYEKGKVKLGEDPKRAAGLGEIGVWLVGIFGPDIANWRAYDPTTLAQKLEPGKLALYLDCGTEDDFALQDGAQYLHDILLDRKIEHEWYLGPGRHDMAFWIARVPKSLAFLRDHTK